MLHDVGHRGNDGRVPVDSSGIEGPLRSKAHAYIARPSEVMPAGAAWLQTATACLRSRDGSCPVEDLVPFRSVPCPLPGPMIERPDCEWRTERGEEDNPRKDRSREATSRDKSRRRGLTTHMCIRWNYRRPSRPI